MASLVASHVFRRVRANLNRVPFSGDSVSTPEQVDDTPSRTVSDRFLLNVLNYSQQLIAESAKAFHLPLLVTSFTGTVAAFNALTNVVRVLPGTVKTGSIYARPREAAEHATLEASARAATSSYPVYLLSDGKLEVYPAPASVTLSYVKSPTLVTSTGATLELDNRFESALVNLMTALSYRSMGNFNKHDFFVPLYERSMIPFSDVPSRVVPVAAPSAEKETEIE